MVDLRLCGLTIVALCQLFSSNGVSRETPLALVYCTKYGLISLVELPGSIESTGCSFP